MAAKKRIKRLANPNAKDVIRKPKAKTAAQKKKANRERSLKGWITRRLAADLKQASKDTAAEHRRGRILDEQTKKLQENTIETEVEKRLAEKLAEKRLRHDEAIAELEARNKELEEAAKEKVRLDVMFSQFVPAASLEYLHRDGTMAISPCILRHLGDVTDQLIARLDVARAKEIEEYDAECRIIADEFGVEVREVYTLGESP